MSNASPDTASAGPQAHALPLPGAWVAKLGVDGSHPQIAKVREVYPKENAMDLVFYSNSGERLGRISPACGGPTKFEPFCGAEVWVEIEPPVFEELREARYGWREQLKPLSSGPAKQGS